MIKKMNLKILLILTVSFCLLFSFSNIMADDTSEVYNLENYNEEFPEEKISSFKEAPELEEKVENGDLPAVEERLPENPLVITPWDDIGQYGGTWKRLGISEEMVHFRTAISGFHLSRYINDGLDIVPNLLTDWKSNEDKSEWTLYFRKGVKWSDGEPFTVDDVLFWYEDLAKNSEAATSVWDWNRAGGELVEMEKIDDYTLKLNYAAPSPLVIGRMAISPRTGAFGHMVLPKHYLKQYHPDYNDEYDNFETLEEKQEWWQNEDMPVLGEWKPVEIDPGERFVLERNPYYFGIDPEGNQLPYIDKVEIEIIFDNEMFKLKASQGESDMQIRPPVLEIPDVSMLKSNEDEYNFETLTWNSASGTGSVYYPNQNHSDPEKKELYQNSKFLKALSHGINREQINKMVYYDTATETTGTFSPQVIEYQSEKGQKIYKEWRDSAKEYDPEKSKALLDELNVIDQNGDGWRQLPNGEDLELRIDMDAEAGEKYTDPTSIVKENWEDIGLEVIINTMDGSQLVQMNQESEFDIRNSWEVANPHAHLMNGRWLVPFDSERWAPLYGNWEKVKGTDKEGTELDKDPRDRTPPREEPPEGSAYARLQELRNKAMVTPEDDAREELVFEMIKIHIEEGPFFIGTAGDYPRIGVVSDRMKNVPRQEDLPLGGYVNPWFSYEDGANPMQFYIQE